MKESKILRYWEAFQKVSGVRGQWNIHTKSSGRKANNQHLN
jgi:hypothetical protein